RQRRRVAELATQSSAFLGWISEEERLVRSGRHERALAQIDTGARHLKAIRRIIEEVRGGEEQLDRSRMEHLRQSSAPQVRPLVGGGVAIVASTVLLAMVFLQGIVQRLSVLRDNARRFSEARPLRAPLRGRDEITEVDRAFHDMAANLNQQKQENEMFVY